MSLSIHDRSGSLSADDSAALHHAAAQWPFDVNLIIESTTRTGLDDDAHHAVEAHDALSQSNEPIVVQQGMSGGEKLLLVMIVIALAGVAVWFVRRVRQAGRRYQDALDANRLQTEDLRAHNAESRDWEDAIRRTAVPPAPRVPSAPVYASRNGYSGPTVAAPAPAQAVNVQVNGGGGSKGFIEAMLVDQALNGTGSGSGGGSDW
jgi:hypothetical protein